MTHEDAIRSTERYFDRVRRATPLLSRIQKPATPWERFAALRELYADIDPRCWDPYPLGIDWASVFTPIEYDMWCAIRYVGLRLWPQYPVDRFFLDFADPVKRIGIECDGKEWHDPAKDKARDAELMELGWTVFRLTGAECRRVVDVDWQDAREYRDEYGQQFPAVTEWLNKTADGLIAALGKVYYGKSNGAISWDEAVRTLAAHTNGVVAE